MVVGEAAAAVELDGGVAMVDFEVKDLGVVLVGGLLSEVEEQGANTLPTMGARDEELVNPGAFATVFEAVIEADCEIGDRGFDFPHQIDDAVDGILQKFGEVGAHRGFVEGLFPGIVELHVAHHREECLEIGGGGFSDGEGHRSLMGSVYATVLYVEIVRGANGAWVNMTGAGIRRATAFREERRWPRKASVTNKEQMPQKTRVDYAETLRLAAEALEEALAELAAVNCWKSC